MLYNGGKNDLRNVRDRIVEQLAALCACGCPHEASAVHLTTDDDPVEILCAEDTRMNNPNCAHVAEHLQPDPYAQEIDFLCESRILDAVSWDNWRFNIALKISYVDMHARTLAQTDKPVEVWLPIVQVKQAPNVEILRTIGNTLLSIIDASIESAEELEGASLR